MRYILTIFLLAVTTHFSLAQNALEVNPVDPVNNPLIDSLVGKLVGNGVIVENIRSNLSETTRALGTFKSNPQLFGGIRSGLMMVTGVADTMAGANTGGTISRNIDYNDTIDGCSSGRQMLNSILAGNGSSTGRATDCATIQFDIIPATDSIKFNYVFASEEYNTFVCSNFNDIFGFFIRGPGIVGDQNLAGDFPNTKNIAIIPGTADELPVSINTVNNGTPGSGSPANCTFTPEGTAAYIDNTNLTPDSVFIFNNLRFNGLTKKLQAAVKVIPCETYTLTLTITDVSDRAFDSGVFIEAGSLRSSGVTLAQTSVFNARFPYAIVDCNPGKFIFERCANNTIDPLTARYKVRGTAVNGVDYKQKLPNDSLVKLSESFVLASGTFMDSITLVGLDNPSWGNQESKTVVIKFLSSSRPYIDLPNTPEFDSIPNFRGDSTVLTIKRKFTYRASNDIEICKGQDSLLLPITPSDSRDRYRWVELIKIDSTKYDTIATNTLSCTNCDNPRTFTDITKTYILFVKDSLSGCVSNDTVNVRVASLPSFGDSYPKTDKPGNIVCPGSPFRLFANDTLIDTSETVRWTYQWTKPKYPSLSSDLRQLVATETAQLNKRNLDIPEMNIKPTYFYVIARNYLGCEMKDSVLVNLPVKPEYEVPELLDICLGDSLVMDAQNFSGLYETKVRILEGSNLTIAPERPSKPLENSFFTLKKIAGDTAVWVIPKVTFNDYTLKVSAINCESGSIKLEGANPPDSVSLSDTIIKYQLNFETTQSVKINSTSCGAFVPNLVLINGEKDRNRGFFVFQITSDKKVPTNWPFLNGGSLHIYNRWGKQVYSTESYNNELTYDKLTSDYQDGVYFYHYKNQEINFEKTGYFNLQR